MLNAYQYPETINICTSYSVCCRDIVLLQLTVKALLRFTETLCTVIQSLRYQVLPGRGSQQEQVRQIFPAPNSILVGKGDHKQTNEQAQVLM